MSRVVEGLARCEPVLKRTTAEQNELVSAVEHEDEDDRCSLSDRLRGAVIPTSEGDVVGSNQVHEEVNSFHNLVSLRIAI